MATSMNGRQDLFGKSVTVARRMLASADGSSIVVSEELAADEEVASLISDAGRGLDRKAGDVASFSVVNNPQLIASRPCGSEDHGGAAVASLFGLSGERLRQRNRQEETQP
jgi:class 3 adenylate cyclase